MHYVRNPAVAGSLGPDTKLDRSTHPPRINALHFVIEAWLGEDLIESFPCFIVTERLAAAITAAGLSGILFDDVTISRGPDFEQLSNRSELPSFRWLRPVGAAGQDDFGMTPDARLVVSDRAWAILKSHELRDCDVAPLKGPR